MPRNNVTELNSRGLNGVLLVEYAEEDGGSRSKKESRGYETDMT